MATIEYIDRSTSGQYTDGEQVERDILHYVERYAEKDYWQIFQQDKRWPVFYHLTELRENILNWYDFQPGCDVLEIGAGMGAVTGALCRKAGSVTAVELTPERAKVIYSRHQHYENLKILVGNFNDIPFTQKYDYITLIGVLEYATGFTPGGKAEAFLDRIRSLLKPGGRLLIAIENRFGCKYWCGAKEDHVGKTYTGINGYEGTKGVQTYSREELKALLTGCGLSEMRFYYPLPDYKMPQILYSDEYLPKEHIPNSVISYYSDRQVLFSDEREIYDSVIQNGVFPFFANSFFVECGKPGCALSDTQFASFTSGGRKRMYQLITTIHGDGTVWKTAARPEAEPFLEEIVHHQEHFPESRLIPFQKKGDGLVHPFIPEQTLESLLEEQIKQRNEASAIKLLEKLHAHILQSSKLVKGSAEDLLDFGFLDMTPGNTFVDQEGNYSFYDQEWMERNVPAGFIMYRGIRALYANHPELETQIPQSVILSHFLKETGEAEEYEAMERAFYESVAPSMENPVSQLALRQGNLHKELIERIGENVHTATFYFDTGSGYAEDHSIVLEYVDPQNLSFFVRIPENAVSLRFDPVEGMFCMIDRLSFLSESGSIPFRCINGETIGGKPYFLTTDPVIEVPLNENDREIRVQGAICLLDEESIGALVQELAKTREQAQITAQEKELMMSGLSWRITKPLRALHRLLQKN